MMFLAPILLMGWGFVGMQTACGQTIHPLPEEVRGSSVVSSSNVVAVGDIVQLYHAVAGVLRGSLAREENIPWKAVFQRP